MLTAIGDALTFMITSVGEVVTAITGTTGALAALLPLFAIGIAASVLFLAVKTIKGFTWGA